MVVGMVQYSGVYVARWYEIDRKACGTGPIRREGGILGVFMTS